MTQTNAGEVLMSDGQTGADAHREQAETDASSDEPTTSPAPTEETR